MSPNESAAAAAAAPAVETKEDGGPLAKLLDSVPQTERDRMKEMVDALAKEALKGTVTWERNLTKTIKAGVAALDEQLSKQLAAIMHHADFQKLEGAWRGLHYLVMNSETNKTLKLKVFNVSKRELFKDVDRAVEFDQSQIYKKLYENEFGMPGGEPYGAIVGDYEFTNHPEDIDLLGKMSNVAAAAFCPFLSAASPELFGFGRWTELSRPRDLEQVFESLEYTKWNAFRETEDSRFVTLSMPRVLARLPYGAKTKPIEEFNYQEVPLDAQGNHLPVPHEHFTWMNASYMLATRMTNAFSKFGWCTAIRGVENGGMVENLPFFTFRSDDGDIDATCPTEIGITDRRENELSKLGFLPLCHFKNKDFSVFFGAQTTQKPKKYQGPDGVAATENAAISARLPYLMACSRIAHYLKVIARDKIGGFMEAADCEDWLNKWIRNYVNIADTNDQVLKAKYPLKEAKIKVQAIPGKPGSYNAQAYLRPHLQFEELTAALMMVTQLPKSVQ
jgi:type VI secretion system protein ImpC